jgi:choline kinase
MESIILGAGSGTRLGKQRPKPLTVLSSGEMIMERQVAALMSLSTVDDVVVVVGYRRELIMEAFPRLTYVFNHLFDRTNTAKSLLQGLRQTGDEDVIWLNGDVVFDPDVVERVYRFDGSCMAVNTSSVGEEEVKYNVQSDGSIREVSKTVDDPLGESVGVNKIAAADVPLLLEALEQCGADDYFERGIELAIARGLRTHPVDITDLFCVEVDFGEDLERANKWLSEAARKA